MSISRISIQRPLMILMAIIAVSLFGLVAWLGLPIDRMPDMDIPYITIQAIYPGAGPEEIENNVVKKIEEQVSTISGVKHITSYCMENAAVIMMQFNDNVNSDLAAIDVKDKIDQILNDLPEDLQKPVISKFDPNDLPIITLAMTGKMDPVAMRSYVDQNLKDRFAQISGVAKVDVTGGREREIIIKLDATKMEAHNLTIFQVAPLLTMQNATIPSGYVTGKNREYAVKVSGEFTTLKQISDLQIPVYKAQGAQSIAYTLRLSDIATITDGYKELRESATYKGKESVQIAITKSGDANTVATAKAVAKLTKELQSSMPQELSLAVIEDKSTFIKNSVDDTYGNIISGIFLTVIILFLFLFDWRVTLIAAVTMPVTLIMSLVGMQALGFSLNMVTMMALTISVGILVTNSIIVIENIVRHRNMGKKPHDAAQEGSDEIFMSILASTLTNLAVFIPIASTTGIIGSVFKELGLTIVFATVASIVLSFTLVPMLASRLLKEKKSSDTEEKPHLIDQYMSSLDRAYEKLLAQLLDDTFMQVLWTFGSVVLLVGTLWFVAPQLGGEFAPAVDEGYIDVTLELPAGTPFSVTQKMIAEIEERIKDTPYLVAYSSSIGGRGTTVGTQYGKVKIELAKEYDRPVPIETIIQQIRPKLADLPDAKISVNASDDMAMAASDIVLEIRGPNIDSLIRYTEIAQSLMDSLGGLTDINSSWKGKKPEILITPNRERLEHYGLSGNLQQSISVQMIGGLMRYNITGNDEAIFREKGEEYPIRVQLDETSRKDISDIEKMQILTPRGPVPLSAIADVKISGGLSSITRKNREKMVEVTCNVLSGTMGEKVAQLTKLLDEKLPLSAEAGYSYRFAGDQEMMEESNLQLAIAAGLAVALTIMLLVALLESLTMGAVIASTIPMGLIGVIWGLYLTNNSLSMISLLSVVMLIGIVVNNAILLIDYARISRLEFGYSAKEAIIRAGGSKLKPIIMSNVAIIVSMLPMALAWGSGGSFRAPFAITAIGGVVVSTLLTFFVIPILYVVTSPSLESLEEEYAPAPLKDAPYDEL